jgi:hypothetical protein
VVVLKGKNVVGELVNFAREHNVTYVNINRHAAGAAPPSPG